MDVLIQVSCGSSLSLVCNHRSGRMLTLSGKLMPVPVTLAVKPRLKQSTKNIRWASVCLAINSSNIVGESGIADSGSKSGVASDGELPSSTTGPQIAADDEKTTTTQPPPAVKNATPKRTPLTAREKLRAARVLSKYTEAKPSKPDSGNKILDALRESDKGKKRSRLPEAPSDLLDDSKRGLPKPGLTFNFPGGTDLLFIVISFVTISTIMFATTYLVWKLGAIHFNEY